MNGDKTLTANFAQTYTLTVNRNPTGSGSTTPSSSQSNIVAGFQVAISATAGSGYTFSNWTITSGNGTIASASSSSTTVTMNGNVTVTANFEKILGTFTDSRNGKTYNTVRIGNQWWMAENLNIETANSRCYGEGGDVFDNGNWKTLTSNEIQANCNKYGRLYIWNAAMTACPSGWHLPSSAEWTDLVNAVGSPAGTKLKSLTGWTYYSDSYIGTNDFGFSALPGGLHGSGDRFFDAGRVGYWWTATFESEYLWMESGIAYDWIMNYDSNYAYEGVSFKEFGYSVRCVGD
jgi:uncharacterized protein (TIGR02145 family)/uncharacterized repeat protein (TIGR02543 family)